MSVEDPSEVNLEQTGHSVNIWLLMLDLGLSSVSVFMYKPKC